MFNTNEVLSVTTSEPLSDYIEDVVDREQYKSRTMDIVSKVSYLAGLPYSYFEREDHPVKLSIFNELEENKTAKIVRILSKIRYTIIRNFDKVDSWMVYDMKNLNSMPELFDNRDINFLWKNDISLVKVNYRATNYIIDINKLITEYINKCKIIFPLWVEWDYIRELFIMPKGTAAGSVKGESLRYTHNLNDYPYQLYLSWAPHEQGNWFYNDEKFLTLLYGHHGSIFYDVKKVRDASVSTKKDIYNYLEENEDTVLVVDCENSDPYKLYGVIQSLKEDELDKIKKILLFDDIHTSTTWQILDQMLTIPVEHILIERVNENKSLTDMRVATATCKEHYVNNINSFVLCSSDSDYWALISSLPEANFLVMIEDRKCGDDILREMDNNGILYCSMDDFTDGNVNAIKVKALTTQVEHYISEHMQLNVNEMLDDAYTRTRIEMTDKEKKQFYDNYIKNMRLTIQNDGSVKVILK